MTVKISGTLGVSSLHTLQQAINTLSNNIANANTPYFSRTDVLLSDSNVRGVNYDDTIRFDPLLATKINQLIAQQGKSDYLKSTQNTLQSYLSNLNTVVLDSVGSIKSAFSTLDTNPDDSSSKAVASESLKSLAELLNSTIDSIQAMISSVSQNKSIQSDSLSDKLKSLSDFNSKSREFRLSSEGRTFANQLVQSLGELVGGTPRFNEDGTVSYTMGNSAVIEASSTLININSFDTSEGIIGGINETLDNLDAAQTSIKAYMATLASAINAANSTGTTTAGVSGGNLYSIESLTDKLIYSGTAADLATHSSSGQTFGTRMTDPLNAIVSSVTSATTAAGVKYTTYASTNTLYSKSFDNAVAEYADKNGVDSDLEAVKLAAYQKTFEAMAKMIQVRNQMLGTIIDTLS